MRIERWDTDAGGAPTEQALRGRLESLGYHVTRYDYPPGTRFPTHTHGVDKIDAVLSARFRITMEGESVVLEAGDLVWVPRGAVHSAEVVGDRSVASLDAVKDG